jgi:hypothetical protein
VVIQESKVKFPKLFFIIIIIIFIFILIELLNK